MDVQTIDMNKLRRGIAVRDRYPNARECCWRGGTWHEPPMIGFSEEEREAIQYERAVNRILETAVRLAQVERDLVRAEEECLKARAHVRDASRTFKVAMAARKFMENLPSAPISIANAVIVWDEDQTRYRAVVGTPIDVPA